MEYIITVIFGLVIGSFLNVCIYRIPRDGSIAKPSRSYCPHCNHTLSALDNIPVFSYLFLRGKCRYCKGKISPRYMIVELLTACIFAFILYRSLNLYKFPHDIFLFLIKGCIFASFLIVISIIDFQFMLIPNKVVYPGLAVGFLFAIYETIIKRNKDIIISDVLGAVAGAVIILLIALLGTYAFKKEAMGMGDISLMAMIGMFVGFWQRSGMIGFIIPVILTIILGSILGSVIGLILILLKRKKSDSQIPFGPFLSIGGLITILYGNQIWLWYHHLMRL
jgi:leader peptidase (prepilin peptidase)/N-methyltransferase